MNLQFSRRPCPLPTDLASLVRRFGRLALVYSIFALAAAGAHAQLGDQCSTAGAPCNNGAGVCLQAVGNKYCSSIGKICGWPGTGGYSLGAEKTSSSGKDYVCTAGGFKLQNGENCNSGTCASGTCLTAISNKYCSNTGMTCGWNNTNGYLPGATKQYNGETYVCTLTGFEKQAPAPTQAAVDALFEGFASLTSTVLSQLNSWTSQAQTDAGRAASYWGGCPSPAAQDAYDQIEAHRDATNAALQDALAMKAQAESARSSCKSSFGNSPMCDATYNTLAIHGQITTLQTAKGALDTALNAMRNLQCVNGCSQSASLPVPYPDLQPSQTKGGSTRTTGWRRGEVCTRMDLGSLGVNPSAFASGNLQQVVEAEMPSCARTERFAICTQWDLPRLQIELERMRLVPPNVGQISVDVPSRQVSVVTDLRAVRCRDPLEVCVPGGTVSVNDGGSLFDGSSKACGSKQTIGCEQPPFGLQPTQTTIELPDPSRASIRWGGRQPGSVEVDLTVRAFAGTCLGDDGKSQQIPESPRVAPGVSVVDLPFLCTQPSYTDLVANP